MTLEEKLKLSVEKALGDKAKVSDVNVAVADISTVVTDLLDEVLAETPEEVPIDPEEEVMNLKDELASHHPFGNEYRFIKEDRLMRWGIQQGKNEYRQLLASKIEEKKG